MHFLALFVLGVFSCVFRTVVSTCASDNEKKICVAPDVLRTLMNMNHHATDDKMKPAFFASLKVGTFTLNGIDDVLKFDDVRLNRGGGYDPSTGYFTAPRNGLYQISTTVYTNDGIVHFQLNKNNDLYLYGYININTHQVETLYVPIEMKKGDRVFIKHRSKSAQKVAGNHFTAFSGNFLYE